MECKSNDNFQAEVFHTVLWKRLTLHWLRGHVPHNEEHLLSPFQQYLCNINPTHCTALLWTVNTYMYIAFRAFEGNAQQCHYYSCSRGRTYFNFYGGREVSKQGKTEAVSFRLSSFLENFPSNSAVTVGPTPYLPDMNKLVRKLTDYWTVQILHKNTMLTLPDWAKPGNLCKSSTVGETSRSV